MRLISCALLLSVATARADVTPPTVTAVPIGSVPKVLLDEWRKADNRRSCAPLWLDELGALAGAHVRRTTFAGGWAVAFDKTGLPGRGPGVSMCPQCGRAVVGIAGVGLEAQAADLTRWKFQRTAPTGIRAGYGLEGFDIGPDWLAYVIVPGQTCLYNVWSYVGREHLESLIDHLRVVDVSSMLHP